MKIKTLIAGAIVLGAAGWSAFGYLGQFRPVLEPFPVAQVDEVARASGLSDCFWVGVSTKGGLIPYADNGATYWNTQFRLPKGATLEFSGAFPHARHLSFNTYDDQGRAIDRLNDVMIEPDAGATNPFIVGARRDGDKRNYNVRLVESDVQVGAPIAEVDARRPKNTFFTRPNKQMTQLWMRVYVADRGLDAKGGVDLPKPTMKLADGSVVQGDALCRGYVIKEGAVANVRVPMDATRTLLNLSSTTSPYHPAQPDAPWAAFYNGPYVVARTFLSGTRFAPVVSLLSAKRQGGYYNTLDNTYMLTMVDRRFGDLLVLQGQAPKTPKTLAGETVMQAGDLRYWSICKYRSLYDTGVDGCLFDEQVPVDEKGNYTIVVSAADKRPSNTQTSCGVAWLDWGIGDGVDNPAGGMVMYRHMIPSPDFKQSIFATQTPGDEQQVLGPYYPKARYMGRADFEKLGCPKGG